MLCRIAGRFSSQICTGYCSPWPRWSKAPNNEYLAQTTSIIPYTKLVLGILGWATIAKLPEKAVERHSGAACATRSCSSSRKVRTQLSSILQNQRRSKREHEPSCFTVGLYCIALKAQVPKQKVFITTFPDIEARTLWERPSTSTPKRSG